VLTAATIGSLPAAQEAPAADSIVIGARWTIHSAALDEDRIVSVQLPEGYGAGADRYPVIYALDGESSFLPVSGVASALPWAYRTPRFIVVAIHNARRTRDLMTSWTSSRDPGRSQWMVRTAGGADRFLSFLRTELIVEIERRYRTAPFRILVGHSAGGYFALHAFATAPGLFQATVSLSPNAFWNDDEVLRRISDLFRSGSVPRGHLFVSMAGREFDDTPRAFRKLNELLRLRAPVELDWQAQLIAGTDHGTTFLPGLQQGLEFVFGGWHLPSLVFDEGIAQVEEYYREMSRSYGWTIVVPEGELMALGSERRARSPSEGLRVYTRYATLYPRSITAVAGLAEALEASGDLRQAVQKYGDAAELARAAGDNRAPQLTARRDSLATKVRGGP
jgi:predicted alpha/beta superfamily hydrolase